MRPLGVVSKAPRALPARGAARCAALHVVADFAVFAWVETVDFNIFVYAQTNDHVDEFEYDGRDDQRVNGRSNNGCELGAELAHHIESIFRAAQGRRGEEGDEYCADNTSEAVHADHVWCIVIPSRALEQVAAQYATSDDTMPMTTAPNGRPNPPPA